MIISYPPADLRPLHTRAQFYGPLPLCIEIDFVNLWNNRLTDIVPEMGLKIVKYISQGDDGQVYALENKKTGKISNVLKIIRGRKFEPDQGAHLISHIVHPSICSPTHFFYQIPQKYGVGKISLTPSTESVCVAMIMPYVEGSGLKSKRHEIAARVDHVIRFGLHLAKALNELSRYKIGHNDLQPNNIIVNQHLEPVIVDFDHARKIAIHSGSLVNFHGNTFTLVPSRDYVKLRNILTKIISISGDIKPEAKQFLSDYLQKYCVEDSAERLQLSQRIVALMESCIDHRNAIKTQSAEVFSSELVEKSIQEHLNSNDVLG